MILLALDTTSRPGSLAVLRDGAIVSVRPGDASRPHGQQLPAEIAALLHEVGVAIADVALYAVAVGPGSFTGLRVGIATIQGLAMVQARSVVGVSTLEALAWSGRSTGGDLWAPWIDAQRGEVFASLYARTPPGAPMATIEPGFVEVEPPLVGRPAEVLDRWLSRSPLRDAPPVFLGSGASRHRRLLESVFGEAAVVSESPLLAGAVGEIGRARAARGGAVDPHAVIPLYVRRPDAELARENTDGRR